ncbi:MAG: choice-of-anchor B family protein [Bacteroidota bacterium]
MKRYLLVLLSITSISLFAQTAPCSGGSAAGFPCDGLDLQSTISLATMGASGGLANDSWGWTDPLDGKEYALVGLSNGTAFIDISVPTAPVYLGKLPTHTSSGSWRDVKTYANHAFIVSEASGHGMQVFDLTRLRSVSSPPVTFTEDAHYNGFGNAHNIVINEDSGYAYAVGTSTFSGGPHFIDISNPTNPTAAGGYAIDAYSHDAQVVTYNGPDTDHTGKEILIGSNENEIVIVDITNKLAPTQISSISYTPFGYTHQGWFTEDQRFFLLGDELDERNVGFNTRTWVFDFSDLDNPTQHYTYSGPTAAIDHNGYVRGNRFYLANYRAGVRVLKVDGLYDVTPSMTEVGYFDTFTSSNSANFNGAWNIYPYFESGNLLISDIERGFMLVKDPNYDNTPPTVVCQNITATLDAATGSVSISALDVDGGSTDDFGITSRSIDLSTFTCLNLGPNNVTLTVEDDYGNTSSCTAIVTVVGETTSYTGGSWDNGTPGIGSNAKISEDYNTAVSGAIESCTCEVDTSRTLTIGANSYLSTVNDITVNGTLIVEHQGSIVQAFSNASVFNNGTINVLQTTPNLASRDFMILGSPMTAETRNSVWNSAFLVLDATTANFVPHPDVTAQFPGAENFADDNGDFWNAYNGSIDPGVGYLVRPQSGFGQPGGVFNYSYDDGTLNNGNIMYPVQFNTTKNDSPNVMANPYPSAIFANDFLGANNMINEVYFWEHLTPPSPGLPGAGAMNFSMEDISMYNLTGGTPAASDPGTSTTPNGYIATGQGFGIKATGAGNAIFTNAMRRTDNNTTLRNQNNKDRIWVKVSNLDYDMHATMLIGFNENASAQLDPGYDSRRLATVVSLYSHLEDGSEELGIQSREAFETGTKVPIGFSTQIEATLDYKIAIVQVEGANLEETTVYLLDHQTNEMHNLSETAYVFSSDQGTFHNRFTLQFEGEMILGPSDSALRMITVFPNPTSGTLNVHSPNAHIKAIEVFDVRGRRFSEVIREKKNSHTTILSDLETGIYFVKITTDVGEITKKIIRQ